MKPRLIERTIDLALDAQRDPGWCQRLMLVGSALADRLELSVYNAGVQVDLTGLSGLAYFKTTSGDIPWACEVRGHLVAVEFPPEAYAFEGTLVVQVFLSDGTRNVPVYQEAFDIGEGRADVLIDPSDIVPDLPAVLGMLSELTASKAACDEAALRANEAVQEANAAIETAREATDAANTAVETAREATDAANTAVETVREATDAANTAVETAREATDAANTAASQVTDAIDDAIAAALAADTAADAASIQADAAHTAAQTAATAATTAATAASSATAAVDAANTAVTAAATAANKAGAAADSANTSAQRADTAAASIEGMTVSEESVPYGLGVEATLSKNAETGAYHLSIQAEQGPQGEQGPGYTILGPAYATVEALAAAVPEPSEGDQYNVGDAPPYHIYRWTGYAWEDQGALQGPQGDPGPGIAPGGTNGQILRKSGDADYETAWSADSVVVYSQSDYDSITTEDRAALYAQGVRLIVVTGNSSGGYNNLP